jgi:hypothetical protein
MKKLVTMRQALSDHELLGHALEGDSWEPWKIVLIAVMGERLTSRERPVWSELTGGREVEPGAPAEETFIAVGRRSGKTLTAATAAVYLAGLVDYGDKLAAGERAVLPLLSATQWQASRCFNFIRGIFAQAPALTGLIESETADALRLRNGVDIECRPASFRTIRGATAVAFIMDELAYWHVEGTKNPDAEILNAARPALSTLGGPLLAISSPYAKRGELWNAYRSHYGPEGDPQIVVINAPSERMNPTIDATVVKRAYSRDPVSAAGEYGAQFRSDISGFLDFEVVDGAVDRGVLVRPPRPGIAYRSACDMSGGSHDSSVLSICHDEDDVAVLDALLEIRPPFNPTSAVEQMAALLRQYGLSSTTGDRYAAGWIPDAFSKAGVAYAYSERDRSQCYLDTLPLFMSGRLKLIDSPKLIQQFVGLERRSTVVGRDKVDHGPGGHDDLANAAALALSQRQSLYWANDLAWVSGPEDAPPPGPLAGVDPRIHISAHPSFFGGLRWFGQ